MSDLVGNPEDRFSKDAAQMLYLSRMSLLLQSVNKDISYYDVKTLQRWSWLLNYIKTLASKNTTTECNLVP